MHQTEPCQLIDGVVDAAVNTDLPRFNYIIPCGIREHGVTSMDKLLGRSVDVADVHHSLIRHFLEIFGPLKLTGKF